MRQGIKHFFMGRSRERKYQLFLSVIRPSRDATILDVGASEKEHSPYDNYIEKRYPFSNRVTALSIQTLTEFLKRYPEIKTVNYNGGALPFDTNQFDVAVANAVIEHVGKFDAQLLFIKEMQRVGRQFFLTTPAREFPIEMHTNYPFIHWFRNDLFNRIVTRLGKGWAAGNYMHLLGKRDMENLLKLSGIKSYTIHVLRFGLLPHHYAVWGR